MFTLPAVSFGRRWVHELSTAEPELEAGSEVYPARGIVPVEGRSLVAAAPDRLGVRAPLHVPAPAGAGSRVPRGARSSCPTCAELGVSHLYLSPVAAGAGGLDARLRRRRPDADLGGARRRGRVPRALRGRRGAGWASCSTSSRTTWRRATRTRSGATRSGARSSSTSTGGPACTGASSTSASSRACGWRIRRSGRRRTQGRRARARGAGRRRADRPSRRARESRAATSSGCARPGVEHVWVEKILEPGERLRPDWPVEGTTGYEFLNDVDGALRRPGRRGAADAALRGADRRAAGLRGGRAHEAKLEQARTTFADEAAQLAAQAAVRGRPAGGRSRRFHVYRTYVEPDVGRRGGRGSRGDRRRPGSRTSWRGSCCSRSAATTRSSSASSRRRRRCTRRASRTRRSTAGTGCVALNEVGGDPGRFSLSVARLPRGEPRRGRRAGCSPTTTHDTKRSGDVRARLRRPSRRMPEEWAALVAAAARRLARPERGVPRPPDGRRRLAARPPSGWSSTSRRRCARRR